VAVTDDNKVKIIESGALPYYVQILSQERTVTEQLQAARGLWILAFKCRESIVNEPGCLEG